MHDKWSPGWLVEGHYISYYDPDRAVEQYAFIDRREFAHYEYEWSSAVAAGSESDATVISDLESTKSRTQLFQVLFGIDGEVYVYVSAPEDTIRHGLPKAVQATSSHREVGHFTQWMSPYEQPDWCTEHFLLRPPIMNLTFRVYNPTDIDITPTLNIYINKCELEPLGYVDEGRIYPAKDRYAEIMDKLYRKVVPMRPVSLFPVRAPAEGV
ncbi:MAG: hypothetical protein ACXQS4_04600 [Methermicoccaceae archaeon]